METTIFELFKALGIDALDFRENPNKETNLLKDEFGNYYITSNQYNTFKFLIRFSDCNPIIAMNCNTHFETIIYEVSSSCFDLFSTVIDEDLFFKFDIVCQCIPKKSTLTINQTNKIYPQVYVNQELINFSNNDIHEDQICELFNISKPKTLRLALPQFPKKTKFIESKKIKWEGRTLQSVLIFSLNILVLFSIIRNDIPITDAIWIPSILFIWLAYLIYQGFKRRENFEEIKVPDFEYRNLLADYEENKLKIEQKNIELNEKYLEDIKEYNYNIFKLKHESKEVLYKKLLHSKSDYLKRTSNNSRGKSEVYFLKYLNQSLLNVLIDISIIQDGNTYEPDFTVICKETGFHLDIEIDEPYSFINGELLHHDRSADNNRNKAFLNNNWGVVRFSEKQIINNPLSCVKLIEDVFEAVKERNWIVDFNGPINEKWNYENCILMANSNYRNTYLPKDMQKVIERKFAKQDFSKIRFSSDDDLPI
jgi:hypothetical protein